MARRAILGGLGGLFVAGAVGFWWLHPVDMPLADGPEALPLSTAGSSPVIPQVPHRRDRPWSDQPQVATAVDAWPQWQEQLRKAPGEWTATQAWRFWEAAVAQASPAAAMSLLDKENQEAQLLAVALLIEAGHWDPEIGSRVVDTYDLDVIAEAADRLFITHRFTEWSAFIETVSARVTPGQWSVWRREYLRTPHGPRLSPLLAVLDFGRGRDPLLIELLRRQPARQEVWLQEIAALPPRQAGRLRLLAQRIPIPEPPHTTDEVPVALWEAWLEGADRRQPAGLAQAPLDDLLAQSAKVAQEDHVLRYRRALWAYHAEAPP